MKVRLKLDRITLIGNRKNYEVEFRDGLNYISGHTSTGKTSILEMINYALGSAKHKSYIEISRACSHVELELYLGDERFRIRRQLFNFTAPVVVEGWDVERNKFLFYNRFEIDSPRNPKSLSAFLLEKMGLSNMKIAGQSFSFRDLYKYCYIKQTEIDNENIMGEKAWEKNLKRKATFEIIFNIYDKTIQELKVSLEERKEEEKTLGIKITGIKDFIESIDIATLQECAQKISILQQEISKMQIQLDVLKKDNRVDSDVSMALRKEIEQRKTELETVAEEKADQEQYISKLRLLINQYSSEIEKKELAIEGYIAFNSYEYLFCPNCLRPIAKPESVETCCLCGSEKSDDTQELLLLKKEIAAFKRKSNELVKFIEAEDQKYDSVLRRESGLKNKLEEAELELAHLSRDYVNPHMEQIEYINYEIGKKNRRIFELQNNTKMFEELERLEQLLKGKERAIEKLKGRIKDLRENTVDRQDLINSLSQTFKMILTEFNYPKLSMAYIDDKSYLPYVRGLKYDDIGSLAGVTLITMAYYLSIMLVGSENEYCHPNLLSIDSPRKNLGAQASNDEDEEFKDETIFNATIKYLYETAEKMKDRVQLIVVNNGYPSFLPKECIIAEFDSDSQKGLPQGLIDDATN